jgi:enediyne biosynthesis protein E4
MNTTKNHCSNANGWSIVPGLLIFLLILSGCKTGPNKGASPALTAPPANDEYFQDIGKAIGIDFVHSIGDKELNNIIESVGGGAAVLDYDQDGYLDIYACSGRYIEGFSKDEKPQGDPRNHLYHNLGNGTFEDVTDDARASGPWYSMGVSVGDYNNDGYPDIYLSNYGPNVLLKNNGNGTFSNVSKKAGVDGGKECTVGSVWLDYDNDGFLDLYVGNYLTFDPDYKYYYAPDGFPPPMAYEMEPDILFHNKGDGTFEDVTEAMGIHDQDGRAMGVGAADYDNDGFVDIFVANDHSMNYLFHNEGGKKFVDKGTLSGTAFSQAGEATVSMSVDFADYNDDGWIDLFVSDDSYCSLYENQGNGIFVEKGVSSGISTASAQFVGWSSSWFDYDNDGDEDIFKANGALKHLYGQESQIFDNQGDGTFKDNSIRLGSYFSKEYVGRGACLGDYDNDGDQDIFVVNLNNHSVFLRNNKGNQNHWIALNLKGSSSNRDAIGAIVKITYGEKKHLAQKRSTAGYLSQSDPRLYFGLGDKEKVDRVDIKWPSGKSQVIENVKANQILTVEEPK